MTCAVYTHAAVAHLMRVAHTALLLSQQLRVAEERRPHRNGALAHQLETLVEWVPQRCLDQQPRGGYQAI